MRAEGYVTSARLAEATGSWIAACGPSRLELRPESCALLVVDAQRFFAHPSGNSYLPASRAVVPRLASLVECWRGSGRPLAFTRHCHDSGDEGGMLLRFWGSVIRCGERDSNLIPELVPKADEPIFRKTTYDSFMSTGLADWLVRAGCHQLLVSGFLTHLCVETTVRSAFVRGFEPMVAADATATVSERMHRSSLVAMAHGFAGILSVESIAVALGCRDV